MSAEPTKDKVLELYFRNIIGNYKKPPRTEIPRVMCIVETIIMRDKLTKNLDIYMTNKENLDKVPEIFSPGFHNRYKESVDPKEVIVGTVQGITRYVDKNVLNTENVTIVLIYKMQTFKVLKDLLSKIRGQYRMIVMMDDINRIDNEFVKKYGISIIKVGFV